MKKRKLKKQVLELQRRVLALELDGHVGLHRVQAAGIKASPELMRLSRPTPAEVRRFGNPPKQEEREVHWLEHVAPPLDVFPRFSASITDIKDPGLCGFDS